MKKLINLSLLIAGIVSTNFAQEYVHRPFNDIRQVYCHDNHVWLMTTPVILIYHTDSKTFTKMKYPGDGTYRFLQAKRGLDGNLYFFEDLNDDEANIYAASDTGLQLYYHAAQAYNVDIGKNGEVYMTLSNTVAIYNPETGVIDTLPGAFSGFNLNGEVYALSDGRIVYDDYVYFQDQWTEIKSPDGEMEAKVRMNDSTLAGTNNDRTEYMYLLDRDSAAVAPFTGALKRYVSWYASTCWRLRSNGRNCIAITHGDNVAVYNSESEDTFKVAMGGFCDCSFDLDPEGNLWYGEYDTPLLIRANGTSEDTFYLTEEEPYPLQDPETIACNANTFLMTDYYGLFEWNITDGYLNRSFKVKSTAFPKDSQITSWSMMTITDSGEVQAATAYNYWDNTRPNNYRFYVEVLSRGDDGIFSTMAPWPDEWLNEWRLTDVSSGGSIVALWPDSCAVAGHDSWSLKKFPVKPENVKSFNFMIIDRDEHPVYQAVSDEDSTLLMMIRDGKWITTAWPYTYFSKTQISFTDKNELCTRIGFDQDTIVLWKEDGTLAVIDTQCNYGIVQADASGNLWKVGSDKIAKRDLASGKEEVVQTDLSIGSLTWMCARPEGTVWVMGTLGIGAYTGSSFNPILLRPRSARHLAGCRIRQSGKQLLMNLPSGSFGIKMFSINGRTVFSRTTPLLSDNGNISMPAPAAGVYLISYIHQGNRRVQQMLVK